MDEKADREKNSNNRHFSDRWPNVPACNPWNMLRTEYQWRRLEKLISALCHILIKAVALSMDRDLKLIHTGELLTFPSGVFSSGRRGSVHECCLQPATGSIRTESGSILKSPGSLADGWRALCPMWSSGWTRPPESYSDIGGSDITRSWAKWIKVGRTERFLVGCPQRWRKMAALLQALATTELMLWRI